MGRVLGSMVVLIVGVILMALSLWLVVLGLRVSGLIELFQVPEIRFHWLNGIAAFGGGLATWLYARPIAVWSLSLKPVNDGRLSKLTGGREVYVFDSPEVNAFALGFMPQTSVIAVSQGLIDYPEHKLREAMLVQVLARNGRSLQSVLLFLRSMTLVFTLLPARMLVFMLGTALRTSDDDTPSDGAETLVTFGLEWLLLPLPALYVRWLARYVERQADSEAFKALGPSFRDGLVTLSHMAPVKETRELFTQPFKFGSQKTTWFSFHSSYSGRSNRL